MIIKKYFVMCYQYIFFIKKTVDMKEFPLSASFALYVFIKTKKDVVHQGNISIRFG